MAAPPLYLIDGFSTEGTAQAMTASVSVGATPAATRTVASGTYAYAALTSITGTGTYTAFAAAVKTAFDAADGPFTVTFTVDSVTGLTFTISNGTTFSVNWSGTSGLRLRAALGFAANLSGATTYTSTVRPLYCIIPAMGARSDFTDVYEPDDIVEEAVSDGGTPYAVAKQTEELWCDWSQTMETKAATLTLSATSAVPGTYQAFTKRVRGQRPFAVYETAVGNRVYKLRAEGASFVPERVAADYDGLWNIPFRTRHLGVL